MKCQICEAEFDSKPGLAGHISAKRDEDHDLSCEEYTVQYIEGGKHPKCSAKSCNKPAKYQAFSFLSTCGADECVKERQSEWSKNNMSFDPGWRKGLTKEDHEGIAKQAEKMKGENNPYHDLDEETKERIKTAAAEAKRLDRNDIQERVEKDGFSFISNIEEEYISPNEWNLKWECDECGEAIVKSLSDIEVNGIRCFNCNPNQHSEETIEKIREALRLDKGEIEERLQELGFSLINEDSNRLSKNIATLKCDDCEKTFKRRLSNQFQFNHDCPHCSPHGRSQKEEEVASWLEEEGFDIKRNVRGLLSGQMELDIYIPAHDTAVEYNGLYYHSEQFKDKHYHLNKHKEAKQNNITLLQFFGDQWRKKKDICKSIILHELQSTPNTIYARECEVELLESGFRDFFEEHHIQGAAPNSMWAFGLKKGGELISCLSMRRAMHYDANEIARFAHKKFHHVPGALSRLFRRAKQKTERDRIITYADLMHGDGNGYENLGFDYHHTTTPNYWYTDFNQRLSRQTYQATEEKPERQIAREAGMTRIYGAANDMYEVEV